MALHIYTKPVKTKGGLDAAPAKAKTAAPKTAKAQPGAAKPAAAKDTFEVKSPRDASSGLATGRRQHLPVVLTME